MSDKSYSQKKRDKLNYREAYFSHNPGIFGCVWTCAYCHRPIVGRNKVEVDHIIPLNNVLGRNMRYNLVAACRKCNRSKSDTMDGRVVEGYLSKLLEVILYSIQKLVILVFVGVWSVLVGTLRCIKGLLLFPVKSCTLGIRVLYAVGIVTLIFFIYRQRI